MNVPMSDAIIIAVSNMVDDAQTDTRKPSHYDIEQEINRCNLKKCDPKNQGMTVGKAKRVRAVLNWAFEKNYESGSMLIKRLIELIRGVGGFRENTSNYIGEEAIQNAVDAFRSEGLALGRDGNLLPLILDDLPLLQQKEALRAYVIRAQRGAEDAALLAGTSKDLLEAVSAYVLKEKWSSYSNTANFPTLLGQAFIALGLATNDKKVDGEPVQKRLERSLYESGCAINQLRNKQGTGHGHPFISTITKEEGRAAISIMGSIAEYMMGKL